LSSIIDSREREVDDTTSADIAAYIYSTFIYKLTDLFVLNTSSSTCFDKIQVNLLAKTGNFLLNEAKRR
jgi:hypothetical protein